MYIATINENQEMRDFLVRENEIERERETRRDTVRQSDRERESVKEIDITEIFVGILAEI